jgi:hypothetical protein
MKSSAGRTVEAVNVLDHYGRRTSRTLAVTDPLPPAMVGCARKAQKEYADKIAERAKKDKEKP